MLRRSTDARGLAAQLDGYHRTPTDGGTILKNHRNLSAVSILLALALLLTTCGTPTEKGAEPTKLKLAALPYLGTAPIAIAQEEGFFAEEGIEIEFVSFTRGAEIIPPLMQGDLDVAYVIINPGILNSISRGGNLKVVSDKGYLDADGCTYFGIVAQRALLENGTLEDPAQLRGKRVQAVEGGYDDFLLDLALARYGVSGEEMEKLIIPPANQPDALANDAVDLVMSTEPILSRILGSGSADLWIRGEETMPDAQWAVIVYGPGLLEDDREAGVRFIRAYLKGARQYNEGKTDRNLEIVSNLTELPTEVLAQVCWPAIREDGMIDPKAILDYQEWAVQKGYLDSLVPVEDFWDPSFVEAARD
jgi:NitT/TauT family transport system substrate-binding protein